MLSSRGRHKAKPDASFYGAVRHACDECRRRKIRCDSQQPCGTCDKHSRPCLYQHVPRRKGCKSGPSKASKRDTVSSPLAQRSPLATAQSISSTPTSIQPSGDFPLGKERPPLYFTLDADLFDGRRRSPESIVSTGAVDLRAGLIPDSSPLMVPSLRENVGFSCPTLRKSGTQLPPAVLVPFVAMFFSHLFPIMPVLDRDAYLTSDLLRDQASLTSDEYCLLMALSAVTIVQLNLSLDFVQQNLAGLSAQILVDECIGERSRCDYMEHPNTRTVLTSFFLFGYYGNLEKHNTALHYLHEAISFAESINLDEESSLSQLEAREGQWRRRIFWLLFITERAYALQRQNRVKIWNVRIELPAIFESEEPRLFYGFVNLINLFLIIDEPFLDIWHGQSTMATCSRSWLAKVHRSLDASRTILGESLETHQLDISISRQWLQVLVWQISVNYGLLEPNSNEEPFDLNYPIQLARDLVQTTSSTTQATLDSHGIGMEQKIAEVASCLTDVLKCAAGDPSEPFRQGRECLFLLFQQLSTMRGVQSRYLQPLLMKTDTFVTPNIVELSIMSEDERVQEDCEFDLPVTLN